jgi:type VI secretion system secreted protein Hcp
MSIQGYVTIHGNVQGPFRGNDTRASNPAIMDFSYQVEAPYDVASGHASGKRQHKPITVVKEWGASTAELFHSLLTNEILDSVGFEFVHSGAGSEVYYTIHLTNAHISQVHHIGGGKYRVSFLYEEITSSHGARRLGANIVHHGTPAGPVPIPYPI